MAGSCVASLDSLARTGNSTPGSWNGQENPLAAIYAKRGDIPLLVGMYTLDDNGRLPAYGPDDEAIGDAIPLAVVTVR